MKRTLRLIYTATCNRSCPGCCNKDFDLPNLPRPTHFNYDEIFITGGEPMLFYEEIVGFIKAIRLVSEAKIYVYTAFCSDASMLIELLDIVDGITLTLHNTWDWGMFTQFESVTRSHPEIFEGKSMRLNIFEEVGVSDETVSHIPEHWRVKNHIEWIVNCPLPPNEVLMKAY
jgi:hypothetical protein